MSTEANGTERSIRSWHCEKSCSSLLQPGMGEVSMMPLPSTSECSTKLMSHGVKRPREDETQGENRRLKLSERMGGPAAKDMRVRAAETVPLRQIKPSLMKRISLPQSRLGPLIHQNSRGLSEERMHLPLYQRVSDKPMTNLTTSPPI